MVNKEHVLMYQQKSHGKEFLRFLCSHIDNRVEIDWFEMELHETG